MGQYDSLDVIGNDEVLEIINHHQVWVCGVLKNVFVKIVQQNGARQGLSAFI